MTHTKLLFAIPATALFAIAACTSQPEPGEDEREAWRTDARLGEQVDRVCFASNIDSFRMATRNSVVVEEGVNDEYLIETVSSCYDLDNANSLSFDTFPGSGCVTKGDSIYAFRSAFGPSRSDIAPVRCPIKAIYEWNEDAIDAGEPVE